MSTPEVVLKEFPGLGFEMFVSLERDMLLYPSEICAWTSEGKVEEISVFRLIFSKWF